MVSVDQNILSEGIDFWVKRGDANGNVDLLISLFCRGGNGLALGEDFFLEFLPIAIVFILENGGKFISPKAAKLLSPTKEPVYRFSESL